MAINLDKFLKKYNFKGKDNEERAVLIKRFEISKSVFENPNYSHKKVKNKKTGEVTDAKPRTCYFYDDKIGKYVIYAPYGGKKLILGKNDVDTYICDKEDVLAVLDAMIEKARNGDFDEQLSAAKDAWPASKKSAK